MKIESRRFNFTHLRPRDQNVTWETIEKFDMDFDVQITLDDGSVLLTSPKMANLIRKRESGMR